MYTEKLSKLSKKEIQVLKLVAEMNTSLEIAEKMKLAPKTVENHRSNIARKLNISGNNCVLKFALANKSKLNLESTSR